VDQNGELIDTNMLEKTVKMLRVDNNIKIAGVLIPNDETTTAFRLRLHQLKSITSELEDAINADFSGNLDSIADFLALRVKRLVGCLGKNLF